jgi:hypothetical protein
MGLAGQARVRRDFDMTEGIDRLCQKFGLQQEADDAARPSRRAAVGLRS